MKKTPFITLRVKKRGVFFISLFCFCTLLTSCLCKIKAPLKINESIILKIIEGNLAFSNEKNPVSAIMPLWKTSVIEPPSVKANLVLEQEEKEEVATPQPKAAYIVDRINQATQGTEILNNTKAVIDKNALMKTVPDFLKSDFSVLILHTHTTESYTMSEKYSYIASDTDRTLDKDYNMVAVGEKVAQILKENGIKVYHDTTINDYPSYNGSYNRSCFNAENFIKNDSSIKIVLDIHRDAIEGKNGEKVKHISKIGDKNVASVMFVVGSDLSGLSHSEWKTNLSFALLLQQHTEKLYPGLCRPLNFRTQRFNQHLAPGAIIVEVGTNGNTLDEALLGAEYFSEALCSFIAEKRAASPMPHPN